MADHDWPASMEAAWFDILRLPSVGTPATCAVYVCLFEARRGSLCSGHYALAYNRFRSVNPKPLPDGFTGLVTMYYQRDYSTVHFAIRGVIRCRPTSELRMYKQADPSTAFEDVCGRCRFTEEALQFFTSRSLP